MQVSVIIPTYNRPDAIIKLLDTLAAQTLPADQFEVVVVDDGSDYDPERVQQKSYPFAWRYLRQENSGATVARNYGASFCSGEVLVVIDDDVTVEPPALAALAELCLREDRALVMGTLISRSVAQPPSPFTATVLESINQFEHAGSGDGQDREVHFSWCNTQLLAVRREDFFALGMLQDPTGGWPNWDDVDFGYRAHLAGFRLLQSGRATGYHWDNSLRSLEAACNRWQRAARSAVQLFAAHPGLQPHLPMLADKLPVNWRQDHPRLIVRKLVRRLTTVPPVLNALEGLSRLLERDFPRNKQRLAPLYLWIQGAYMSRGYYEGLQAAAWRKH